MHRRALVAGLRASATIAVAVTVVGCAASSDGVSREEARSRAVAIIDVAMRYPNDSDRLCNFGLSVEVCERDVADFGTYWPTVAPTIVCDFEIPTEGIYVITLEGRDGQARPYVHHMAFIRQDGSVEPTTPVFWLNMEAPSDQVATTPATLPETQRTPQPAC